MSLQPQVPPAFESREDINPTLLMSWWATAFSATIIVVRIFGRYVRLERFFPEDKIMMVSLIPLVFRMVAVHFVLTLGTNNVQPAGLTVDQVSNRETGSKVVLAARVCYAIFIWTAKISVCEFLKRVTGVVWRKSVAVFLRFIHFFLVSTFIAVVIATLAECQPFNQYWQVVPTTSPACRCGYAQLITMGTCDIITDLLLVAFPVPIIMTANMPIKRKLSLVSLLCLSLVLVGITCYRVPSVIKRGGNQPYRSLIASFEILAATAVSNALVIGSFVRDRGAKKLKYKRHLGSASVLESVDDSHVRRNTVMQKQWGSDCDLAGDLGIRLDPDLCLKVPTQPDEMTVVQTPPTATHIARTGSIDQSWSFGNSHQDYDDFISATGSLDRKVSPRDYIGSSPPTHDRHIATSSTVSSPRVSFFDVGGLLSQDSNEPGLNRSHTSASVPAVTSPSGFQPRSTRAFLEDLGVLSPRYPVPNSTQSRSSEPPASGTQQIRTSTNVELHDVGGLLGSRSDTRP